MLHFRPNPPHTQTLLSAPLPARIAALNTRLRHKAASDVLRAGLEFFEIEQQTGMVKVNPLAYWGHQDVQNYFNTHHLPRHPLVAQGYPSIGCAPCTTKIALDEAPRSGRWRGQTKNECGIHFADAKIIEQGATT